MQRDDQTPSFTPADASLIKGELAKAICALAVPEVFNPPEGDSGLIQRLARAFAEGERELIADT